MIKTLRYFIFFLNFDLAKGGSSAPLALPLVALLRIDRKGRLLRPYWGKAIKEMPLCSMEGYSNLN